MNIELIKQKSGIVGESEEINQVLEMVSQVAGVDISVLINGESGTGKELVAKAIHTASMRSSKDLIINVWDFDMIQGAKMFFSMSWIKKKKVWGARHSARD